MSCTPERRESGGSASSLASTNLVFGSTRRYSRAYDAPIVTNTSKGPTVRIENEDGRMETPRSNSRSTEGFGMVLNPEASVLGSLIAKISIGVLSVLAVVISLVGKTTLLATSQLFGFIFMFAGTFAVYSGLYLWWSASNKHTVPLSIKSILYVYISSSLSGLMSKVLSSFATLQVASSLPFEASYYIFLVTSLFLFFSLLAHRDNLNGMFSQEACVFVGLTVIFDFMAMCLFGDILPSWIYPQLVFSSILMGLTLSLMGNVFPHLSPTAVYWAFKQGVQHRPGTASTQQGPGGRQKRISNISMDSGSSLFPRTSVSSMSSYCYQNQPGGESELITEAHGLITDLLITKESLNNDAQTKLKRVKDLLTPKLDKVGSSPRRMYVGNHIGHDLHDYEYDVHTPVSDVSAISSAQSSAVNLINHNRLSVSGGRTPRKHRSSSVTNRQTVSRFSTTTTASGMPVLDNEPVDRQRSVALREVRARISVQEKRHSVHKMGRERLGSLERLSKPPLSPSHTSNSPLTQSFSTSKSDGEMSGGESGRSPITSGGRISGIFFTTPFPTSGDKDRQPVATPPESPSSGPRKSHDDGNALGIISEEGSISSRPRSNTAPNIAVIEQRLRIPPKEEVDSSDRTDSNEQTAPGSSQFWAGRGNRPTTGYCVFSKFNEPSLNYELSEYTDSNLPVFEHIGSWDFPVFELEERCGNHILSQMAYVLFQESGLIETFKIPQREFINFFRALEANYGSNVYHNKTHAADVLHGVSYLLFEMIPGFSHEFSEGNQREWKTHTHAKGHGGNIASAFSILEVFACYVAAAMHDFDHPGRTNAFLVATKSPLAILYNDRSVLESHHAAASWDLLTCVPAHNFLTSLDESELKRFRFLVVEAILATDLKMHFEILADFKTKTNPEDGEGIEWTSEVDRLMVMKMIIKMADINTPTKNLSLHRAWTERITEEFYQQADEETSLGLPPTIFMDRSHSEKLPAIQLSFIQHLVSPLFQASATAGIIPGILETVTPSPSPELKIEGDPSIPSLVVEDSELAIMHKDESIEMGDDAFTIQEEQSQSQKFMSILLTNLEVNYEAWRAELPKEDENDEGEDDEQEKEESVSVTVTADSAKTPADDDDDIQTPTTLSSNIQIPNVTISEEP